MDIKGISMATGRPKQPLYEKQSNPSMKNPRVIYTAGAVGAQTIALHFASIFFRAPQQHNIRQNLPVIPIPRPKTP